MLFSGEETHEKILTSWAKILSLALWYSSSLSSMDLLLRSSFSRIRIWNTSIKVFKHYFKRTAQKVIFIKYFSITGLTALWSFIHHKLLHGIAKTNYHLSSPSPLSQWFKMWPFDIKQTHTMLSSLSEVELSLLRMYRFWKSSLLSSLMCSENFWSGLRRDGGVGMEGVGMRSSEKVQLSQRSQKNLRCLHHLPFHLINTTSSFPHHSCNIENRR